MRWSSVSRVPKLAHATVLSTARNTIDQLVWEPCHTTQCLVKDVPPASGGIIHAICRFLQSCRNVWRSDLLLVAIDTQHHSSHHKTVLEEKLSQDQCGKDLNFCLAAIWQLNRNPGLVEAGESVCNYSLCLSWNPLSIYSRLCPEDVALLVGFNGRYPSTCYVILRFELPQSHTTFQHVSGLGIVGHLLEAQSQLHTWHRSQIVYILLFSGLRNQKTESRLQLQTCVLQASLSNVHH